MQLREVEIGQDYAWNPYKRNIGFYYPGDAARLRVQAFVKIEVGRYRPQRQRGLKVKVIKPGRYGPTKKGAVVEIPARELTHPWSVEEERIVYMQERDRLHAIAEFRRSVLVTHTRIRLACRRLRADEWNDPGEFDLRPRDGRTGGFKFSGKQLGQLLDHPGVEVGLEDPRKVPVDLGTCPLVVRSAGRAHDGEKLTRIYCNGIPVTSKAPRTQNRRVYDVLIGKKPLPDHPFEEGE